MPINELAICRAHIDHALIKGVRHRETAQQEDDQRTIQRLDETFSSRMANWS